MFKVTQFEPKLLSWWNSNRKKIDISPPYQRKGRLWSATDKALLIDTVLNEFDIPKIYIADFTFSQSPLNKAKLPYAIIDGKQRLEAIFDFFDNKLPLSDDFALLDEPKLKLGGLTYQDLRSNHAEIADRFDNFCLTVMRAVTDEEEKIQELFVRLNRSKPLTGAEIRNAVPGPVSTIVRDLSQHEFFRSVIRFSTSRAQDQNAAAKLLMFEFIEKPTATKKKNLDAFATSTNKKRERVRLSNASKQVLICLDQMASIFVPRDQLLTSAGFIPVYYWFIRNVPERHHHKIREFLIGIQKQQKDEVQDQFLSEKEGTQYIAFARSINDEKSLDGLCKILLTAFARYK